VINVFKKQAFILRTSRRLLQRRRNFVRLKRKKIRDKLIHKKRRKKKVLKSFFTFNKIQKKPSFQFILQDNLKNLNYLNYASFFQKQRLKHQLLQKTFQKFEKEAFSNYLRSLQANQKVNTQIKFKKKPNFSQVFFFTKISAYLC